jgi:diguanylate cyclase (GGDEF)-like protein
LLYPLGIINAVFAVTLVISQFFGLYYYIDSDNIYHRGPFFLIPAFIVILLILVASMIIIKNRRNLGKKSFISLIFFAIPPFIGVILQIAFYGTSFVLNSVVLSLLVIFLNIQNHSMYTDYLTGVSNRKKLDAYLKKKITLGAREKAFSAILVDINNFKYINDTYGHIMGDNALETAAKLLKSCIRSSDFIARYGGDEFCIVLDIADKSDLEVLVCRTNNCIEKYNSTSSNPYKLEFSMGYAIYDYKSHKSAEEFLKLIDMLMYENKQANKNKLTICAPTNPVN